MTAKGKRPRPKYISIIALFKEQDNTTIVREAIFIGTVLTTMVVGGAFQCSHTSGLAQEQKAVTDTIRTTDSARWTKRNKLADIRDSQLNAKLDRNYAFDTSQLFRAARQKP